MTNVGYRIILAYKPLQPESAGEIVYVRADNGKSEFGHEFQSYCREVGIQLEPSPPYKHSMNGVVERWMGSTKTIARSILYEARLPHQLWDYAIEHAVWIKNRVPTAALPFGQIQKKTPFEAYHGKLPSLKNLKVFGCKADVLYPPDLNFQTWVPRIREGEFSMIGMRSSKIWRLLDISTLREVYSSDAKFKEYSFRSIDTTKFTQSGSEEAPVQSMHREIMPISGRPKGVKQKSKVYVPMCPMEIEHHPPLTVIAPQSSMGGQPNVERRSKLDTQVSLENESLEAPSVAPSKVERRSRFGRLIKDRVYSVFSRSITVAATAFQAVHINKNESSSIQVSTPPFESITIEQAMEEDKELWTEAIISKLQSLEKTGTFTIMKG